MISSQNDNLEKPAYEVMSSKNINVKYFLNVDTQKKTKVLTSFSWKLAIRKKYQKW